MVLTEHRCGHFWHRNLAEAAACHQALTDQAAAEASSSAPDFVPQVDARESAVLIAARLWPGSTASGFAEPAMSPLMPLPARVERSIRLLDLVNLALGVLAIVLVVVFAGSQLAVWLTSGGIH